MSKAMKKEKKSKGKDMDKMEPMDMKKGKMKDMMKKGMKKDMMKKGC